MAKKFFLLFLLIRPVVAVSQSLFNAFEPGARAIAFGKAITASVHDPIATLWNPAALAFMRDAQFQISSDGPYSFNFIGVSQFFPAFGNLSFSLSEYRLQPQSSLADTTRQNLNRNLRRASLGYGKMFSPNIFAGSSFHLNRFHSDKFVTLSLGLILFPGYNPLKPASLAGQDRDFPFNAISLPQKFSIAMTWQDISPGYKKIKSFVEIASFYQFQQGGLALNFAFRTDGHQQSVRTGLAVRATENIAIFSGLRDFNLKKAALGMGILAEHHNIDIAYSFEQKSFMIDFSVRLGKSPRQRAASHKKKSLLLARNGAYKKALREIHFYQDYQFQDTSAIFLESWLVKKVDAYQQIIEKLLAEANKFERKQWYISATLDYLKILQLDKDQKIARTRLKLIQPMVDVYINQLYKRGVDAYEDGRYEQANRAFKAVLSVRKDHQKAREYMQKLNEYFANQSQDLFLRGLGYYSQKNYAMAIHSFRQALKLNQDNEEAQNYLKKAVDEQKVRKRQYDGLMTRAQKLMQKKDFAAAFDLFAKALEVDPYRDEAKKDLLKLKPILNRYVDGLMGEGKAAYQKGNFEKAESVFRTALKYDPNRTQARQYLAKIRREGKERIESKFQDGLKYFNAKQWSQAISAFETVLAMNSKHKRARKMLREAYSQSSFEENLHRADDKFSRGEYLEAMAIYSHLMERDSTNRYIQARLEECQAQLNMLVEKYFNLGITFFTAERYRDAIQEWDKALKINPNHAQALAYKKKAQQRLNALKRLQ